MEKSRLRKACVIRASETSVILDEGDHKELSLTGLSSDYIDPTQESRVHLYVCVCVCVLWSSCPPSYYLGQSKH